VKLPLIFAKSVVDRYEIAPHVSDEMAIPRRSVVRANRVVRSTGGTGLAYASLVKMSGLRVATLACLLCASLFGACGSDDDAAPATSDGGAAGEATAGAAPAAGQSAAGSGSEGGQPPQTGGAGNDAGAAGGVTPGDAGAGGVAALGQGELLFEAATQDTGAGALFQRGLQLYWRYDSAGKSFVATGPLEGGERVDLIESSEPITTFDVRKIIAYQAGGKLFVHPLSATPLTPVELAGAPTCVALTSGDGNVYCRSDAGTIVRWAEAGGAGTVIASAVPPGGGLIADDAPPLNKKLFFCEDTGKVSSIPLSGFGGGPLMAPQYFVINQQQASPGSLRMGVPGDEVLYWLNAPDGMPARVRGSAKTTPPASSAGPPLERTRVFTPYSWAAGAIVAIERDDESAELAYVRFSQTLVTTHYVSPEGVVALAATSGRYYWLDRAARLFGGDFK
jgi:hypothetical protein